jgi:transketolase
VLDRTIYAGAEGLQKGAYVLADLGDSEPELILMASGSEVCLITGAGARLASEGINVRLVSFPSWELFQEQDEAYRNQVLPPDIKLRLSVEAGVSQGWEKWVGDQGACLAVNRFGASAPYKVIFEHYGFTVDNVIRQAQQLMQQKIKYSREN